MKRYLILIVSLISVFSLMACVAETENKDFSANVVLEQVVGDEVIVHVVITEAVTKLEVLAFIANEIAVEAYQRHIDAIQLNEMTLTVYLYASDDAYTNEQNAYGYMVFLLNSPSKPGLSEGSNHLKLN